MRLLRVRRSKPARRSVKDQRSDSRREMIAFPGLATRSPVVSGNNDWIVENDSVAAGEDDIVVGDSKGAPLERQRAPSKVRSSCHLNFCLANATTITQPPHPVAMPHPAVQTRLVVFPATSHV